MPYESACAAKADVVMAGRGISRQAAPIAESALHVASRARQVIHNECQEPVQAMRRSPDERRTAILLVALEGLTCQRAAEIRGVPIGTIMSRLFRGREQLRQLVSDDFPTDEDQST